MKTTLDESIKAPPLVFRSTGTAVPVRQRFVWHCQVSPGVWLEAAKWMLLFSSDGIRRLSFQGGTADHLFFWLLLVC